MNPAKRKKMYRAELAKTSTEMTEVKVEEVTQQPVVEPVVEPVLETIPEVSVEEVKTSTRRSKKVVEPVSE